MNLHEQFYDLRERVWTELENTVHTGCDFIGEFPTAIGEIYLDNNSNRGSKFIGDCTSIVIHGIIKDENYSIHPKKEENDLYIITNKISVIIHSLSGVSSIIEVGSDVLISYKVFIFTADFPFRNCAHGNKVKHRSIVVASKAYKAFSSSLKMRSSLLYSLSVSLIRY